MQDDREHRSEDDGEPDARHDPSLIEPAPSEPEAPPADAATDLPPMRRRKVLDGGFWFLFALACSGGVLTLLLKGWDVFAEVVATDFGYIIDFTPKVIAGVVIAVLLPLFVDPATLNRWVGPERGWQGLALAGAFGAAAPGGPSVVFTLSVGLLAAGADRGAVGAFVTGWALLSLNRTLVWELAFLPFDMVLLRVLVALPVPILAGLAMRRLGARS